MAPVFCSQTLTRHTTKVGYTRRMFGKYQLQPPEKRKRLPIPHQIGRYQAVVSFDFVAANPLEVCMSRLGSLQDLRELDAWSPKVRVNLDQTNEQTVTFTVRELAPAPILLTGYVNDLNDDRCYVSGEASAQIYLQLGEVVFLGGLLLALTIFIGVFVFVLFAPPLGVFLWYSWRGAQRERDRLIAVLKDTLSYTD
jgi:hypothetical protein